MKRELIPSRKRKKGGTTLSPPTVATRTYLARRTAMKVRAAQKYTYCKLHASIKFDNPCSHIPIKHTLLFIY